MNLANKLTLLRIALVPFIILFMYLDSIWTRMLALLFFVVAALTDAYDGFVARKYNTITTLGIFLDPLADKLLVSAAFISFVGLKELHIPAWMIITITSREFIITGLRSLAASKNILIPAHKSGKFKTTSQIIAIITLLIILIINSALHRYFHINAQEQWVLVKLPYWLMFVTTALTIYSGLTYLYRHRDLLKESL